MRSYGGIILERARVVRQRVHGTPDDHALHPRSAHLDKVTGELGREHPATSSAAGLRHHDLELVSESTSRLASRRRTCASANDVCMPSAAMLASERPKEEAILAGYSSRRTPEAADHGFHDMSMPQWSRSLACTRDL